MVHSPESRGSAGPEFPPNLSEPYQVVDVDREKGRKQLSRRPKWLIVAPILVTLALGTAATRYLYTRSSPRIEHVTARVDRGDIEPTVTTSGNLNAVVTVQVGSQVSGNILALYADFNTRVKRGQLIAQIDPAPFKAIVDQSMAGLNAARAGVVTARATLARSQSDVATAQANLASQQANVVKAKSAMYLAQVENTRAAF